MSKKDLTETEIRTRYIDPAIKAAGWDFHRQVRQEVTFTDGPIIVRGKITARGKGKRVDYLLFPEKNLPLAVIEAKSNKSRPGDGMQQCGSDRPDRHAEGNRGCVQYRLLRRAGLHLLPAPGHRRRLPPPGGFDDRVANCMTS